MPDDDRSIRRFAIVFVHVLLVGVPVLCAVLHLALIALFFDNFRFARHDHAIIILGTLLSSAAAGLAILVARTRFGFLFAWVAAGLCAWSVWLWADAGAEGLLH